MGTTLRPFAGHRAKRVWRNAVSEAREVQRQHSLWRPGREPSAWTLNATRMGLERAIPFSGVKGLMGEDRRSPLNLNSLLAAVEAAPPVAAVDVLAGALAEAIGAREVSFLIADFSGRSLIRLGHSGGTSALRLQGKEDSLLPARSAFCAVRGNKKGHLLAFLKALSRTRTADPPPYHALEAATVRNRRQRFRRDSAVLSAARFAAGCHQLQPRGSIKAPSCVVRRGDSGPADKQPRPCGTHRSSLLS
jgi:hypothetical protein